MTWQRLAYESQTTAEQRPLRRFLFPTVDSARRVLSELGCRELPGLQMKSQHAEFGRIHRIFGVVENVERIATPVRPALVERLRMIVRQRHNRRILYQMQRGDLDYTPVNRRVIRWVLDDIGRHGVHLPWAFSPMNLDFGQQMDEAAGREDYSFRVFYNQNLQLRDGELSHPGPLFSLPTDGSFTGTWHEQDRNFCLDPKVALIVEANVPIRAVAVSAA